MYIHKHYIPPCLAILQNQKYIVPGWVPVPMDTELTDIEHQKPETQKPLQYQVVGSKGAVYTITVANYGTYCSCPAGRFKHKCKHIKQFEDDKI